MVQPTGSLIQYTNATYACSLCSLSWRFVARCLLCIALLIARMSNSENSFWWGNVLNSLFSNVGVAPSFTFCFIRFRSISRSRFFGFSWPWSKLVSTMFLSLSIFILAVQCLYEHLQTLIEEDCRRTRNLYPSWINSSFPLVLTVRWMLIGAEWASMVHDVATLVTRHEAN